MVKGVIGLQNKQTKPFWVGILFFISVVIVSILTSLQPVESQSLACFHETSPDLRLLDNKFEALCISNVSNYSCVSMVMKDGNVINTMPMKEVKEFGTVQYFESDGNIVHIDFSTKDLVADSFNLIVRCGNETESFDYNETVNFTYDYISESDVVNRMVYVKENTGYLILGITVLFILGVIVYVIKKA